VSRPRRRAAGRPVVLAAVALVLTGCVQPGALESELVACKEGDDGEPANGVVLMAQAVPTASFVPCLRGMPLGWHFSDLEVRNEEARFWLDSDRDGFHAIEVRLTAECDTRDATEINTDRDAMRRFELVREVSPRFIADRFYVFDGGCVTVAFTLSGDDRVEPLAVATEGIGMVARDDLREHVRDESGGRLELDPAAEEEDGP
jgi:hypothetical protein